MIKAKFIKATPIEGGITYILKGERTKDALRAAVDLDNEDCIIEIADKQEPQADSIWEFAQRQARELDARLRSEFNRGREEGYANVAADMERTEALSQVVHESPEHQAEVIKAHDKIEDNKGPYGDNRDNY